MEANRFDRFARSLARRMSRRHAIQFMGGGGLGAATRVEPFNSKQILAQSGGTCSLDLTANVRIGPSAESVLFEGGPGEFAGLLTFSIRSTG
jgi:hypothetical protein